MYYINESRGKRAPNVKFQIIRDGVHPPAIGIKVIADIKAGMELLAVYNCDLV